MCSARPWRTPGSRSAASMRRARHAGRAPGPHRRRCARHSAGLPCKGKIRQIDGTHPKMPKRPLLCDDIVRHVGDPIAFIVADDLEQAQGRGRADRGRLRAAAGGRRHEEGARSPARRWSGRNTAPMSPSSAPRGEQGRRPTPRSAKAARIVADRDRQQPPRRQLHGDARRRRRIRRRDRPLHADPRHPGRPRHARPHRQGHPAASRATRCASSRPMSAAASARRLRYHEYPLAAIAAKQLGRPVKWIGDRTEHFLVDAHGRDNIAVAEMAMDDERPVPRHARRPPRQYGRLSLAVRAVHSRWRPDHVDRRLRHPASLRALPRRLHQHRAGRRLSRRRAAGGRLSGRAPGRRVRPRHRPRPGRDPPAELHPARADALPHRRAGASTTPASSPAISTAPSTSPTGRASTARAAAAQGQGQDPRLRHRHLCRGLRLPGQGGGDGPPQRRTARRRSSSARRPTARATPPPMPSSSPAISGSTTTRSRSSRATPTRSRTATAPAARARSRSARSRSTARRSSSPTRSSSSPPRSSRPRPPTSNSSTAASGSSAPTARMTLAELAQAAKDREAAHRLRRLLRAAGADLSERHPPRRGRDRSGDRRHRDRRLLDRRRFRRDGEPDPACGPGPWRHRPGHRPGALREHRLRRRRPAPHRLLPRLHHAARRRRAVLPVRDAQRAVDDQRLRHQGRGRGGLDRLVPGGDERHRRRAQPRLRHHRHRHAGDAGKGLEGDPGGEG